DYGAKILSNGDVQFKVWAPKVHTLALTCVNEEKDKVFYPMKSCPEGVYELTLSHPTQEYFYSIDNKHFCPDPYSRWQPFGVHGPSRIYNPNAFVWDDENWKGILLSEYII